MGNTGHCCHLSSAFRALLYLGLISASLCNVVSAQIISTSTPVPPLQWINLTPYLTGSAPPPLKDVSIGYDNSTRTLLIFGGESQEGVPQSQTFLLDLASLAWTKPIPPSGLTQQPPARSAATSARDVAASYRNGHVVFGGMGINGPLSDVWEYSFDFQFWSQVVVSPGGPSPRWAAAGGNDIRTATIQDPHENSPNNSFYVAGGFGSQGAISLSDIWRFNITGDLSSNLPNSLEGSWEMLTLQNSSLPAIGGSASATVMQSPNQLIAAVGGCSASTGADAACADSTSFVIDIEASTEQPVNACPAPRVGASLASNPSLASSSFGSQVFLLLGTFNNSVWQDGGGLNNGEIDVLDINTKSWARILPTGDPTGNPTFPTPREGAAVFSYQQALAGLDSSRSTVADTIIFGGRDASGNYLSDIWLLRAYNGVITQSNQHWSGFGGGSLQSGVDADGEGVTVTYMQTCATQIGQPPPSPSANQPSTTSEGQPGPSSGAQSGHAFGANLYDTSTIHKALAPVSVALALPAFALYRLSLSSSSSGSLARYRIGFTYLSGLIALSAYAVGLAGLVTAFTSIKYNPSLVKRASVTNLTTTHGQAGIALFVGFYGLVPILLFSSVLRKWKSSITLSRPAIRTRNISNDLAEKQGLYDGRSVSPGLQQLPAEPQTRVRSGDSLGPWSAAGLTQTGRTSSDTVSAIDDRSSPSTRSFEVTNRPTRARHASAHSLGAFSQNLNGMSWSAQRRSPSRMDDIDGTLSRRAVDPSTPGTAVMDFMSAKTFMDDQTGSEMPPLLASLAHFLIHAFLLGLCVLSLVALWKRAPTAPFAIFLVWTVCGYLLIVVLAWFGIPRVSILSTLISRLRADSRVVPTQTPPPGPANGNGPYQNQPPYRAAHESDYMTSISHAGHTLEDDDYDEDDDRLQDEMNRRDVNIVTSPRRKLKVMNPELQESS